MRAAAISLTVFFATTAASATLNNRVELSDLSSRILETAYAAAPGVEFESVSIELENGVAVYELEATGPDGKHIEVDVYEDGRLQEIEMEMSADEVPEIVMAALERRSPGFEPSYIEASIRPDGVFLYEFEGVAADGQTIEIEIGEDGEVLSEDVGAVS